MTDFPEPLIYVVDDDEAVRDSLQILLESHGKQVATYASVRDFLDSFDPARCGCLLLDMHLPVMGGMELLSLLRERGSTLPVIMITGGGDARVRSQVLKAGAFAFFEKPVADERLLAAITDAARMLPVVAPNQGAMSR